MLNLTNRSYQNELQDNGVLPAPIKGFEVEHVRGDWYRGYMILEDGSRIWCNTGAIGCDCFGAKGDIEKVKEGFKKDIEKLWYSRRKNFGVLVR